MYDFLTDEKTMLIFRTYWPIIAILIGLLGYIIKRQQENTNLRTLLKLELTNNVSLVFLNIPKKSLLETSKKNPTELIDSARTLSYASKHFSYNIYDKYLTSMLVLSKKEKKKVFLAYTNFKKLEIIGSDISELLKIESRSDAQKKRLEMRLVSISRFADASIDHFTEALKCFGFSQKSIKEIIEENRGLGTQIVVEMENT
jgi:hypothetical protein